MKRRLAPLGKLLVATLIALSSGCSLLALDPVTDQEFDVSPISNSTQTVTFLEPMIWSNAPMYRATKGVRLLEGVYHLEAESDHFLYFRSPKPIEMRVLNGGQPVDGRDYDGGLALAKSGFARFPAVAYVSMNESRKMHVMKMGFDFLHLKGRVWEKNF